MTTISRDLQSWLTHYIERKECLHKSLAISLQKQLDSVHSLDHLDSVLGSIKIPSSRKAFFGQETPDLLVNKLNAMTQTIQQVKSLHNKKIHLHFVKLSATKKTRPLISILEEVLTQPSALLHMRMLNLLHQLNELSQLQHILNHLEKQPYTPRPIHTRPGTFESIKPLCMEHRECLDLLRSNSATYKDGIGHSIEANILLQTVLKIYQDSYTMPSLDLIISGVPNERQIVTDVTAKA